MVPDPPPPTQPPFNFCRLGSLHWDSIAALRDLFLLLGSLFIFQGPYFQCFGSMHAKNVCNVYICLCWVNLLMKMVLIYSGTGTVLQCWQIQSFTALNVINHHYFGRGSLFHKKLGPYCLRDPFKFKTRCTANCLNIYSQNFARWSQIRSRIQAFLERRH